MRNNVSLVQPYIRLHELDRNVIKETHLAAFCVVAGKNRTAWATYTHPQTSTAAQYFSDSTYSSRHQYRF